MKKRRTRLGIVAAEFNPSIVDAMVSAALSESKALALSVSCSERVPGCYEIPLVAKAVIARKDVDALVVLGYIERGETLHGEVMGHVVHRALVDLSLAHDKPVGLGIIGPGATVDQAQARKDDYARAAVKAALGALKVIRSM